MRNYKQSHDQWLQWGSVRRRSVELAAACGAISLVGASPAWPALGDQIAVFRPATAEWFLRSDQGTVAHAQFGGRGDVPVPGDYHGRGRAQIAVFRPATGEWFIREDDGSE